MVFQLGIDAVDCLQGSGQTRSIKGLHLHET
jgi:hypothetical protein